MYTDFSLHFTLKKGLTVKDAIKRFNDWKQNNPDVLFNSDEEPVLHHCFLTEREVKEKKLPTELVDGLKTLAPATICWNGVSQTNDLEKDRELMMRNLGKACGVAIFIGEVAEVSDAEEAERTGTDRELELAYQYGVTVIKI